MDLQNRLAHPRVTMADDPVDLISKDGWARLAASVDEGPLGWTARTVAHPLARNANGLMHVTPPSGGVGYLLKVLGGDTLDRAAEQVAGHWSAARRLADQPIFRVPMLYGVSVPDDAILMQFVPGESLQDILTSDAAPAARLAAVERCALWLRGNMQAGAARDAPVPVGTIGQRLHRLIRDAKKEPDTIWQADAFNHLADLAQRTLDQVSERPLPTGARHGDANPGNFILYADGAVYGLDLLRPVPQHLCQDLAYLLARSLPYLGDAATTCARLGEAVEMDADMALATTLCLRIEMLGLWRRMPKPKQAASKPIPQFIKTLVDDDQLHGLAL